MRRTIAKGLLQCCVVVFALSAVAWAQQPRSLRLSVCKEGHWLFLPEGVDALSEAERSGLKIDRAYIRLPDGIQLSVFERPKSGRESDNFNSSLVIRKAGKRRVVPLRNLTDGGEYYRLVWVGSVCRAPEEGALVLVFESAFTGADEAFVVVRYSHRDVRAYGLPPAHEARIVLWSGDDSHVEIWSGSEEAATPIDCDACARYYSILRCSITAQRAHCKLLRKTSKPLMPDKFMGHRIEIIPKRKRRR